jgi:hypothetical protein
VEPPSDAPQAGSAGCCVQEGPAGRGQKKYATHDLMARLDSRPLYRPKILMWARSVSPPCLVFFTPSRPHAGILAPSDLTHMQTTPPHSGSQPAPCHDPQSSDHQTFSIKTVAVFEDQVPAALRGCALWSVPVHFQCLHHQCSHPRPSLAPRHNGAIQGVCMVGPTRNLLAAGALVNMPTSCLRGKRWVEAGWGVCHSNSMYMTCQLFVGSITDFSERFTLSIPMQPLPQRLNDKKQPFKSSIQ